MFSSEKVKNYLQSVKLSGESDKATIQASFYITPLNYDILYEVDDRVARQLFHREGNGHTPVAELGKTVLNLGELGIHNLEIFPHSADGADGAGQMIAACRITEVCCDKLFSDKNDWSLIWKAILPLDSHSLGLMHKYFKKNCYITLVRAQEELFETDDSKPIILDDATVESVKVLLCESCKKTAVYLDANQSSWCADHVGAAVGVQVRKIKYASGAA